MVTTSKNSFIKNTSWPESCPKPGEASFISIGCGNSTISWGLHSSASKYDVQAPNLQPSMRWSTPHLLEADVDGGNCLLVLASLMPQSLQEFFFGIDSDFSETTVKKTAKQRESEITFYIVSSNEKQTELIGRLLSCVPCRAFLMNGEDFYPKSFGKYDGMGVDRCACLKGSVALHGAPVLVFDAGTAMTYCAVDSKGMILGGGIGPGIKSKFRSMHQDTGALPFIEETLLLEKIKKSQNDKIPLSIFAKSTEEAMIVAVLNEIAAHCNQVINVFKQKIVDESNANAEGQSSGKIIITGGNGEILISLLARLKNQIIESCTSSEFEIILEKALLHIGVGAALQDFIIHKNNLEEQKKELNMDYDENDFSSMLNRRIAKRFNQPCPDDNDHIYRGTVTSVTATEAGPVFRILYDDNDKEDVLLEELKGMIQLFSETGEKADLGKKFRDRRVAKYFGSEAYEGTVKDYNDGFFQIVYDDGDEEDQDMKELEQAIELYEKLHS